MAAYEIHEIEPQGNKHLCNIVKFPAIEDFTLDDAIRALELAEVPDADEFRHGGAILKVGAKAPRQNKGHGVIVGFAQDTDGTPQKFQPRFRFKFSPRLSKEMG